MQACARISDRLDYSDISLHGKRSDEESKAIHFIRSHLGIMRFGKRNEAQFDTTHIDNRIDLDHIMRQNDESSIINNSNDYSNSYVKATLFDSIN
ncbi:unnamed protein product [Brugia timori]|uniref:Transposase n=1 Tax=Brugia timori TaxID=42155 RepID=A0A0R3QPY0_9BILA|nr:unnamed protein product [Brugia timori]